MINCAFQDDYSRYGIQGFSKQLRLKGGCLAFQLTVPKSPTANEIQEMADKLQGSSARVVVVFASEGQLLELFLEVGRLNRLKSSFLFFFVSQKTLFLKPKLCIIFCPTAC